MTEFSGAMLASFGASGVLLLHAAFVAFVVLGGLFVVWRLKAAWLHLPALAWGVWISAAHAECPLTPLENALRYAAGEPGFYTGFVEHYLDRLVYPPWLSPDYQVTMAALLVAWNALLYGWALLRHRDRHKPHHWGKLRVR